MNNQESSHEISVNEEDLEFLEETKIPGTKQTPDHSPIAYINSTITITPRILFEHAHQQWFGSFLKYSDCISDFIDNLNNEPNIHRYLVLDNCHDIFNEYNKLTLKSLLSLSALVNNSITVVCISNLTWELMTDYPNPPTVLLQALADDDAIDLLSSECPEGETPEFYKSFVKLVYMSFSHATRDLNEQRYLIKKLWPKYMEPVYSNEVKRSQTTKLFAHLQPFVKASLRSLFLHTDTTSTIELPRMTKYLVIAAFLASYNPSKMDSRFFTRAKDNKKAKLEKKSISTKKRQQLIGPRVFPIQRLLAIFYSIIKSAPPTFDVHVQLATLFELKLILKSSSTVLLDGVKGKVNVSFDTVKEISNSLGFEIGNYLFDFIDN